MPDLRTRLIVRVIRWQQRLDGLDIPARRARIEAPARLASRCRGTREAPVDAGGVTAQWVQVAGTPPEWTILYLHGGAYALGSFRNYGKFMGYLAKAAAARVLFVEYRLAPEHPFPAALDDTLAAYRWLNAQGVDRRRLAVAGDSAGGGLALALLLSLRDAGEALPQAAVCLSPEVDLTMSSPSIATNASTDTLRASWVGECLRLYVAGADPKNPLISPLYGDLQGLPPLLIQVGGAEMLRDEGVQLAERARAAGVAVTLEVWPGMFHVWQAYRDIVPDGRRALAHIGQFLRRQERAG